MTHAWLRQDLAAAELPKRPSPSPVGNGNTDILTCLHTNSRTPRALGILPRKLGVLALFLEGSYFKWNSYFQPF